MVEIRMEIPATSSVSSSYTEQNATLQQVPVIVAMLGLGRMDGVSIRVDLQLPNDPLLLESLFTSKQLHSFCLRGPSQQIRIQKLGKPTPIRLPFPSEQGPDHQTSLHRMARLFTAPCFGHMIHPQRTVTKSTNGFSGVMTAIYPTESPPLIYPWTDWFTTFLQLKRQLFFPEKSSKHKGFNRNLSIIVIISHNFPSNIFPAIGSDSIC